MSSGPNLGEISIGKQIRTQLEKCTYEQVYDIAICPSKEYKYPGAFNPLGIIHSILSPVVSGGETAEEYINLGMRNLARNLAIEVIAEKFPDHKQPTKLEDYL